MSPDHSNDSSARKRDLTENEIQLGARAQMLVSRALLACVFVTLAGAVIVTTQVPLDTTMVYNRLGSEFRVPLIGMLAIPALLSIIWLRGRKDRSGEIPTSERYVLLTFGGLFVAFGLVGQIVLATGFLESGLGT